MDMLGGLISVSGLAAGVATCGAVASFFYAPRLAPYLIAAAVALGAVAYVSAIADARDAALARAVTAETALADELARAEKRRAEARRLQEIRDARDLAAAEASVKSRATRERILRAPISADGPTAPVLRDTLEQLMREP